MYVRARVHFSAFHRVWYLTRFFAEEKDSSVGSGNGPSHTKLWPKQWNNTLARSSRRLPKPKKFLYFVIRQNRNKKAVTMISSRAKCLTTHAGRISSHLKTPVVSIYSLLKSSLKAQAKQRKGMKMERKWTMRESKWTHNWDVTY